MPSGVSGTLEFRSTDYNPAVKGARFRLTYSEIYDVSGNYSDITFSKFEAAGIGCYGQVVLSGKITVNGTEIVKRQDTDIGRITSGDNNFVELDATAIGLPQTVRVPHNSDGTKTIAVTLAANGYTYFNLWFNMFGYEAGVGNNFAASSQNIVLTSIPRGLAKIHNGTSFENYSIQIYNGSSWDRYTPYVYNGSSWEAYNGG